MQNQNASKEIEDLTLFARLDDDSEENPLLSSLLKSAKIFLANAGVREDLENELYKTALKMLATAWYENRDTMDMKGNTTQSFALNSIIAQLKASQKDDI